MTIYPSVEEVVKAHERLIRLFGGANGVRDLESLDSALARPRNGHYEDVIQEAAALLESLSQNHPFIDGNKRTAFAVTAAFLQLNGYRLTFEDVEAYRFMIKLYDSGKFCFDQLEPWLRQHARPMLP